jgi:hypothetical protein
LKFSENWFETKLTETLGILLINRKVSQKEKPNLFSYGLWGFGVGYDDHGPYLN